jgi:hypothetical protein
MLGANYYEGKRGANIKKEGTEGAYNPPNYPVKRIKMLYFAPFLVI